LKKLGKLETFLIDESGTLEVTQQLHNSYSSGVAEELGSTQIESTEDEVE
jgi:hypothetical protein